MDVFNCKKRADHGINEKRISVRSTIAMRALKKTAIGLSLIALTAFGGKAQQANDNRLAFNDSAKAKTEKSETKALMSPVVLATESDFEAAMASRGGVAVHITHSKNDTISGFRYAKGFANGFTNDAATGGKPIYATATFDENTENDKVIYEGPTFVQFYVNGGLWDYKGDTKFEPHYASKLLPLVMNDYVAESGYGRILPKNTKPTLVTSLD